MKENREFTIRVAGEAGQGMKTIGHALSEIFVKSGQNIFSNIDYMSRIRGGNNFFQVRVSEKPVYTLREKADIIVALDGPSVSIHENSLTNIGIMVLDSEKFAIEQKGKQFFDIPFYRMAREIGGSEIFINSVACGIISALSGINFGFIEEVLKGIFRAKTSDILNKNIESAKKGYDFAQKQGKTKIPIVLEDKQKKNFLMDANTAITLGAIKAGCKFYTAYPMTPSTSIMAMMAHYAERFNIVVEQAEDEIAAVNMAIGASFAGARAMTSTSGGGFALMVEGLSLAGMTETPLVMVDAQRPAPATGFPTRTEQADLGFLLHAGHGEFAKAIYAPGTIEEAFYLAIRAFDVADKYQIPVMILTDQHLADSTRNIDGFDLKGIKVTKHVLSKDESKKIIKYSRYKITPSGISPRAVPSWIKDAIYVDSDEHTEEGHITESGEIRVKMVEKRFYKKMQGLQKEIIAPTFYNTKGARIFLVGFGSTFGALKEVSDSEKGIGVIHLSQVWPFPSKALKTFLKEKRVKIITVENNAGAQLAKLMRRETGLETNGSILRFDGRPFNLDYLINKLKQNKLWK